MSLKDDLAKAPAPGSVIAGKYVVEGMLGVGGMGLVLAAVHRELEQKVAIKILLPEAARYPDVVERFAREARAAAKIHGEHVARVIDVGQLEDGSPYMVMEHLDGRDLAAELRARGSFSPAEVTRWILQACEAIAQAHAARIVHRDLKPSNLFLARQPDSRFVVKVLDFGISKIIDVDGPALTKTSSLVGTPYYMSPEQLTASKTVDRRTDIWALGVIMYELLAGTPPFTGESMPEIVAAILQNQPVPLDSIRVTLPKAFIDVIAKCMQSRPDDRYADVAALATALHPFGTNAEAASAGRIARVLGIAEHVEPAPDTEAAPVVDRTMRLDGPAPIVRVRTEPPVVTPVSPAAITATTHARTLAAGTEAVVAASVSAPPAATARRSVPIGIAVAVAVAGVCTFLLVSPRGPTTTAPSALVATSPPEPSREGPAASASASAESSAAAMPPAPPPSITPSASPSARPSATGLPFHAPAPRPAASVVAPPPDPTTSKSVAPAASKSPLDMGIK